MNHNKQILRLEVKHYDIAEDGTTIIEISIHNYKEIIKKRRTWKFSYITIWQANLFIRCASSIDLFKGLFGKDS